MLCCGNITRVLNVSVFKSSNHSEYITTCEILYPRVMNIIIHFVCHSPVLTITEIRFRVVAHCWLVYRSASRISRGLGSAVGCSAPQNITISEIASSAVSRVPTPTRVSTPRPSVRSRFQIARAERVNNIVYGTTTLGYPPHPATGILHLVVLRF